MIKMEPSPLNECQIDGNTKENLPDDINTELNMAVEVLYELKTRNISLENKSLEYSLEDKTKDASSYSDIKSTVKCDICSQYFLSPSDLDIHREICENANKNEYTCTICNIEFKTQEQFDDHTSQHDENQSFACQQCESLFKSKKQFLNHSCMQKMIILRTCDICGKEFAKASSLKNHLKIHSYQPGRDFVVPAFCETVLTDNTGWPNDVQTFLPLSPQLDISNNQDNPNWNVNLSLNLSDSFENKDLHDLDNGQDMIVNTSYSNILDNQSSFHNEFENIDEISVHSDSMEFKQQIEIYDQSNRNSDERESQIATDIDNSLNIVTNYNLYNETKKKPHTCKYCGVSFTREKALISHERLHQDNLTDILECKKCHEIFFNKEDLKSHLCSKNTYKTVINQYNPTVEHNPPVVVTNPLRGNPLEVRSYETENIEFSREHCTNPIDSATIKQNKHTCEHCFKRFTTKQKKFRHMWIHRNKTFSCEICADSFSTQEELNEHRLSSHEGNTPHGCAICGKYFASRQGLWEHMRLHKEGSAPHQCNLCGKTFTSRQGYHIHARTHTGERPYGCRYCWKAFRDGGTLRKHERIHTGERPHVCPLCQRAFNQKVVLREHVRWLHAHHQPDRNQQFIQCPIPNCQHTLTDKEDLCAHIVKHSDALSNNIEQSTSVRQNVKMKVKPKPLKKLVKKIIKHDEIITNDDEVFVHLPDNRCEMCGETFSHREHLLSHINIHI